MAKMLYLMRFWSVLWYFMKIYGDCGSEGENAHDLTFLDSLPMWLYNEVKTEKGEWIWLNKAKARKNPGSVSSTK